VLIQRWVHDLAGFGELEVPEQEAVFGRTKLDSVALDRSIRPPDAHITRAEVHDAAGNERPIYRRSVATGTASEQGLIFVAFSAERDRFDAMLASMYGLDDSGIHDRLLEFSTPVTGSYYFAPSAEELDELGIASERV
jgi:putative iron-dependent peroxidase